MIDGGLEVIALFVIVIVLVLWITESGE